MSESHFRIFFGLCLVLVLYVFYLMLRPFLEGIILSLTLVSLFHPNYLQLKSWLRGHASLSSLLMCTVLTFLIIIPSVIFFLALFQEIQGAYQEFRLQQITSGDTMIPGQDNPLVVTLWSRLGPYLGTGDMDPAEALSYSVEQVARFLLRNYSDILGGLGTFFLNFFVMILSMFFFFRDGDRLLASLKELIPLAPGYQDMVVGKLREVTYATFFGIIATGICQGMVAGLIFFALDVGNPILWGAATALFSLVPLAGTSVVWVPMSVYFFLSGDLVRAVLILVLGAAVIGLVDNIVRPLIIEGRSEGMHLLLVFFSLAGGLFLFGPAGLLLGPLVAALLVTLLAIYRMEFRDDLSAGRESLRKTS